MRNASSNRVTVVSYNASSAMEDQTRRARAPRQNPQQRYLFYYNGINLVLWSVITFRAVFLIPTLTAHDKLHGLHEALFPLLKWTQTLALLEILHSIVGLVRANPLTTVMQVASRLLVVWGVVGMFPQIVVYKNTFGRMTAGSVGAPIAFAGILVAWGVTECIRYGFFVYKEGVSPRVTPWLTWLRYNTFFVLYPLGISSECWLIYCALAPAGKNKKLKGLDLAFKAILLFYIPGSYVLYTHMMSQRRKIMKGKGKVT